MIHTKRGLKTLVPFLLAAFALMAGGAQAVTWDVEGKEIPASVTAAGKLRSGESNTLLIPALNVMVLCGGATITEMQIRTDNTAHAIFNYSACKMFIGGKEAPGCAPPIITGENQNFTYFTSGKRTNVFVSPTVRSRGPLHVGSFQ